MAEYRWEKVDLNKRQRIRWGDKKRRKYVKKPSTGNIVKVEWWDVDMKDFTQHKDKERRKKFKQRFKWTYEKAKKKYGKDVITKPIYHAYNDTW